MYCIEQCGFYEDEEEIIEMSVHITTGNKVDVIQELVNGEFVIVGIQPWEGELIPLLDPRALAAVILDNLGEGQ